MAGEETTDLIREAVHLLRILAIPQLRELRQAFATAMLASPKRRQMWQMMDGTMTLANIGRKVGTSSEAVRQFVAEIEEKWPDLVEVRKSGGAAYPKRLV